MRAIVSHSQLSIQADSKKYSSTNLLTQAFLGTSERGCRLRQKVHVDRAMILSCSALSKYRWYSV